MEGEAEFGGVKFGAPRNFSHAHILECKTACTQAHARVYLGQGLPGPGPWHQRGQVILIAINKQLISPKPSSGPYHHLSLRYAPERMRYAYGSI